MVEKVISCAHSRALITFEGLLHSFGFDLDFHVFFVLSLLWSLVSFSLTLFECGLDVFSLLLLFLILRRCLERNCKHHLFGVFFL